MRTERLWEGKCAMRAAFHRKLSRVRLRCSLNVLLAALASVLVAAGIIAAVGVAAERTLAARVLNAWTAWGLLVVATAAAGILWRRERPTRMGVALLMDERLGLHERFSTALALADRDDEFARAAVADAYESAERVETRGRFPVRPSARWIPAASVWLIAAAGFLFLPEMDLLGSAAQRRAEKDRARRIAKAGDDVKQAVVSVESTLNRLGDPELAGQLADLGNVNPSAKAGDVRRQAIRKLGDISEKIRRRQGDRRLGAARTIRETLMRMRGTPEALSRELNQAIAKGDFARASNLVKDFQDKLADGKLSKEQKEALAKQLENLAGQLSRLAQRNEGLEEELDKLGLDKDLARLDEEQLRNALKKAGLSDEQIDELMDKSAACRSACDRLRRLGEAMDSCCGEGGELSADELVELAEQLDSLEALEQALALTEAGLAEIEREIARLGRGEGGGDGMKGLEGVGLHSKGLVAARGTGAGAAAEGRGEGAKSTDEGGKTSMEKTRVGSRPGRGPIIASWYFKGPQIKGDSRRKFAEVVRSGRDRASEAIGDNRIPRKYEAAVKKYFTRLEEVGEE